MDKGGLHAAVVVIGDLIAQMPVRAERKGKERRNETAHLMLMTIIMGKLLITASKGLPARRRDVRIDVCVPYHHY